MSVEALRPPRISASPPASSTAASKRNSMRDLLTAGSSAGRGRRVDQAVVPVLVGLAVPEAPHIEPGRRVGLRRIVRILQLTTRGDDDEIAFGNHGHYLRSPRVARRNRSRRTR